MIVDRHCYKQTNHFLDIQFGLMCDIVLHHIPSILGACS